jgi:hypothetical protein
MEGSVEDFYKAMLQEESHFKRYMRMPTARERN